MVNIHLSSSLCVTACVRRFLARDGAQRAIPICGSRSCLLFPSFEFHTDRLMAPTGVSSRWHPAQWWRYYFEESAFRIKKSIYCPCTLRPFLQKLFLIFTYNAAPRLPPTMAPSLRQSDPADIPIVSVRQITVVHFTGAIVTLVLIVIFRYIFFVVMRFLHREKPAQSMPRTSNSTIAASRSFPIARPANAHLPDTCQRLLSLQDALTIVPAHRIVRESICVICMEELYCDLGEESAAQNSDVRHHSRSTVVELPCAHLLHHHCFISWLMSNIDKNCPVCRAPVLKQK